MNRILLLLFAASLLGACAKKVVFNPSTQVPGATGSVRVKKDNNANYALELNVRNLPDADDLQPPKRGYTVWVETNDHRALNIGSLVISSGLFSKKRKGKLETTSSFKPVRVFVTPEDEQAPTIPGAEPVLTTKLFRVR